MGKSESHYLARISRTKAISEVLIIVSCLEDVTAIAASSPATDCSRLKHGD
jgi:hypothetical protein